MKDFLKLFDSKWTVGLLLIGVVLIVVWIMSINGLVHSNIWSMPLSKITYGQAVGTALGLLFIFNRK